MRYHPDASATGTTGREGELTVKNQMGPRLRGLRKDRHLTLAELAKLSDVSVSTISKIENGALSPTMDVILRLCEGLAVTIGDLVNDDRETVTSSAPNSRFSPARLDDGVMIDTPNYEYLYLCSDVKNKRMIPIIARVKAGSMKEFGDLVKHGGEEFLFVLQGSIEVHSEHYAPIILQKGEGVYLDSAMGYAYVNTTEEEAEVLCICTEQHPPNEQI